MKHTGKLDRRTLPAPVRARPDLGVALAPPRTPVEEALAGMWAEALGLNWVSIDYNFFDLGGHSLLAARIISNVNESFGVQLSMRSLLDAPTIADLANLLSGLRGLEDKAHQILCEPAGAEETGER